MASSNPTRRVLVAKVAAYTRWSRVTDRAAAMAPARHAAEARFARQVDPDGTLDPQTRAKLADSARKAFYAQIALKSHQARRAKKAAA